MSKIVSCYLPKSNVSQGWRLSLKAFNISVFILALTLGAFYLINVSDLTVKGFALRELKAQSYSVASETRSNEEKIDSLQSYYSLNSRTQKLNMVAVGNIEYLALSDTVVAKK